MSRHAARPQHNRRAAMLYAKKSLWRHSTAVFGQDSEGAFRWGSGILVSFRNRPLVLTCHHVRAALAGPIFLGTGGDTWTTEPEPTWRSDAALDTACLVLGTTSAFEADKAFYRADESWLGQVHPGDPVWAHGYPMGGEGDRRMGVMKPGYAVFKALTYETVAVPPGSNRSLGGRRQSRAEWNFGNNLDEKFRRFTRDLTAEQRRGMSGGAITVSDGILPGRLAGHITHMTEREIWFNPIGEVLRWLSAVL
jgi:hypothetical protein